MKHFRIRTLAVRDMHATFDFAATNPEERRVMAASASVAMDAAKAAAQTAHRGCTICIALCIQIKAPASATNISQG